MKRKVTAAVTEKAREYVEEVCDMFTDGDFEIDETLPVTMTGDEDGVWVPCRIFVRWEDLENHDE